MKELIDSEINIAVAEWMGWKPVMPDLLIGLWDHPSEDESATAEQLPQFISDLNAIAHAEARLTLEEYDHFAFWLSYEAEMGKQLSATARQRCVALLRTVRPELFQP